MGCFADSSAVVKLYSDENGSDVVAGLEAVAVSALATVEVPAAIWRKSREGDLTGSEASVLVRQFETDISGSQGRPPRLALVAMRPEILAEAASLLPLLPLRAYDAIQLAGALAVERVDPRFEGFACFDAALRRAAEARGLALIPPV